MNETIVFFAPNDAPLERVRALAPEGIEVRWVDANGPLHAQAKEMKEVVAVIVTDGRFDVELARLCPRLKLVQATSAGVDQIDVEALGEMGVQVANNGGGNAIAVAEHTIGLMISVLRKLDSLVKTPRPPGAMGG